MKSMLPSGLWLLAAWLLAAGVMPAQVQIKIRPQEPPALQPAPEQGKGAIEGVVVNQVTHEPLRKAQVVLGGTARPLRAVTGADGRFVFRGLPESNYYVNVDRPGFQAPGEGFPPLKLGRDEQKTGIELAMVPNATISGTVVNEYGRPVPGCSVNTAQLDVIQGVNRLNMRGGAATNEKGEYHIEQLAAGRYYVTLQCFVQLPLPHPLMERDDPRIPYAVYAPQIYPGGQDFVGAARITLATGAELRGVDFRVHRTAASTVQGSITGDPAALNRDVQVMLLPTDPGLGMWIQFGGGVDKQTRRFLLPSVLPGSYLLAAAAMGEGPSYQARVPVVVGDSVPEALEISLTAGPELKGTVEIEGENAPPLDGLHLSLAPLDMQQWWQRPAAQVGKDGKFALSGVWPGRWRLEVQGAGYVKSLRIGAEEVSPFGFTLKPGMEGDATLVLGTKYGRLTAAVTGPAEQQFFVVAVPEDPALLGLGLERTQGPAMQGRVELMLVPGRYRVFAVETPQGWALMNRPALLKAMAEKRGQAVEILEDGRATVTPGFFSAAELKRLMDDTQ